MAEGLSLDSIKEMKKADFVKAFKNKAAWKKAEAVILLVDYKLDGKKCSIAIPSRKTAEMKAEMKRLKKEKLHLIKKSGGGSFSIEKNADGIYAKIELLNGGLSPKAIESKISDLFDILKIKVITTQSEEAAAEAAALPAEADSNENLPEDSFEVAAANQDDETFDREEKNAAAANPEAKDDSNAQKRKLKPEEKAKMVDNMKKMEENLDKIINKIKALKNDQ